MISKRLLPLLPCLLAACSNDDVIERDREAFNTDNFHPIKSGTTLTCNDNEVSLNDVRNALDSALPSHLKTEPLLEESLGYRDFNRSLPPSYKAKDDDVYIQYIFPYFLPSEEDFIDHTALFVTIDGCSKEIVFATIYRLSE